MVNPNPNPSPNAIPLLCNVLASHSMLNGATEKKKKKKSKKSEVALQPLRCDLCKVDCSGQDVFNRHTLGKRHKKNRERFEELKNAATAAAAAVTAPATAAVVAAPAATSAVILPEQEAGINITPSVGKAVTARGKAKRKKSGSACKPGEDLETKKHKLLECGTTADSVKVCTICNVVCNSETVYKYHLAGQKHATLLRKQMQKTAAASALDIGPQPVTTAIATATSTVSPVSSTVANPIIIL